MMILLFDDDDDVMIVMKEATSEKRRQVELYHYDTYFTKFLTSPRLIRLEIQVQFQKTLTTLCSESMN
jgi:hypothetical protein